MPLTTRITAPFGARRGDVPQGGTPSRLMKSDQALVAESVVDDGLVFLTEALHTIFNLSEARTCFAMAPAVATLVRGS
jgi:hypothetical protein